MKTLEGWDDSKVQWDVYAQPGDEVEENVAIYFAEVVPPTTQEDHLVQVGEPYDEVDGEFTYATFEKIAEQWYYRGYCPEGSTIEKLR